MLARLLPQMAPCPADADPASPRDADEGVDVTLIRWMLSLSPEDRLAVLQGFVDSVAELTHASSTTEVQRRTLEERGG
jgi:hypothetical protein